MPDGFHAISLSRKPIWNVAREVSIQLRVGSAPLDHRRRLTTGHLIPDGGGVNGAVKRKRNSIGDRVGPHVMDVRAHHAASHEDAPIVRNHVDIHARARKQPCAFEKQATIGGVDHKEITAGTKPDSREWLSGEGDAARQAWLFHN